ALHEPFDKVEAFAVGGADYITKPFHLEEVLVRVQSQLARHFYLTQIQRLNDELEKRVKERTRELTESNRALQQEIADRQQIEENLWESEAKFRQISEHIQEVFWLIRYDAELQEFAKVEYVSPAFTTIWGRTCESLYENPWEWIAAIHPDDRHRVEVALTENAPKGSFEEKYRVVRPDGTIRWIRDRGFPVTDEKGRVYRVAGIAEDSTELERAEATSHLLASVVESSHDAIVTQNLEGTITSWNVGAEKLFGYTAAEAIGQKISMLVPPDRLEEEPAILNRLKKGEGVDRVETVRLCKDRTPVDVSVTISPLKDSRGKISGVSQIIRNISARKRAELERDRFFNLSPDLLFIANGTGKFKRLNAAWMALLDYTPHELLGQSWWHFVHPDDRHLVQSAREQLYRGEDVNTLEIRCRGKDGTYYWLAWNIVPFLQENLLYGAGRNISQRKASEARLVYETLHDSLTDLANRAHFMQQLEIALKKGKRQSNSCFAVLFIDLDDFKRINDTLGHALGDELLVQISQILQTSVREVDLVARLGGDEFVILLEEVEDWKNVFKIVERIQERLKSSFRLNDREVFTSASIGIVFSKPDYQDPSEILRDADIAMYRAKANGKGCYEVFDRAMYAQTLHWVELERALRYAIANRELLLYYQPIVSLRDNLQLEGFEVLLRWHHPEKGLVPASEFIPIAEETGLICAIGDWVLQEACFQFQQWRSIHPDFIDLYVSINISGRQLRESSLLDILDRVLQDTQIPHNCLKLEITESSLIENTQTAARILQEIQRRGIAIGLDDFGTGFSSLHYLHQFPLDILKIDRAFVETLQQGVRERSIIHSIVMLARALDFATVAEGIETQQQLEQLQRLGCESGQGYFFSKPMSREQIETLLQRGCFEVREDLPTCSDNCGMQLCRYFGVLSAIATHSESELISTRRS
ncbi:MAG: EAL domain-containing protein, partial [Spirulina sp.]